MPVESYPGNYPGTITSAPDVVRLAPASNLVCRARVKGIDADGDVVYTVRGQALTFHRKLASARVERTYSGTVEAGSPIRIEFLEPDVSAALTTLREGEDAVLFLIGSDDRYRLTDFGSSKIPLDDPAALASIRPVLTVAASSGDVLVQNVARAIATDLPPELGNGRRPAHG